MMNEHPKFELNEEEYFDTLSFSTKDSLLPYLHATYLMNLQLQLPAGLMANTTECWCRRASASQRTGLLARISLWRQIVTTGGCERLREGKVTKLRCNCQPESQAGKPSLQRHCYGSAYAVGTRQRQA